MTVDHNGRLERYADSAAGASEGQAEPVYQVKRVHGWVDVPESRYTEIKEDPNDCGELRILYLRPSAEIAALLDEIANWGEVGSTMASEVTGLRERIAGMEKDAPVTVKAIDLISQAIYSGKTNEAYKRLDDIRAVLIAKEKQQ